MVDKVKVTGLKEISRALKELHKDLRKKELTKALRKGANIIRKEARIRVPTDEAIERITRSKPHTKPAANLRRSIAVRQEKKKFLKNTAKLKVGVLSDSKNVNYGAYYWRFVEFDHVAAGRGGRKKQAGQHVPARPFLVPAFESKKFAANDAIVLELKKGVERSARRVKK